MYASFLLLLLLLLLLSQCIVNVFQVKGFVGMEGTSIGAAPDQHL